MLIIISAIIEYAFFATIWVAAICIIKDYRKKYPKEGKKMFDFNPGKPNKE